MVWLRPFAVLPRLQKFPSHKKVGLTGEMEELRKIASGSGVTCRAVCHQQGSWASKSERNDLQYCNTALPLFFVCLFGLHCTKRAHPCKTQIRRNSMEPLAVSHAHRFSPHPIAVAHAGLHPIFHDLRPPVSHRLRSLLPPHEKLCVYLTSRAQPNRLESSTVHYCTSWANL